MDRYACGEASAFSELYDLLAPRLSSFLLRRTRDRSRAEDLLQQTFLQMHSTRRCFAQGAPVVRWEFAISLRLLIDTSCKRGRQMLEPGVVGSLAVAGGAFFAFDGLRQGEGRPLWFHAASSLGWAALAAVSVWAALHRRRSAVGRPQVWLMAFAIGTPVALFAMMLGLALAYPEATLIHPERVGLKCLGLTIAAGAFPLVALALLRRRSDPVHPAAAGAALGSACGASAGVMVELWCPVAAPRHVAVGHIAPLVAMAPLGGLLGARIIAMRALRPGGARPRGVPT